MAEEVEVTAEAEESPNVLLSGLRRVLLAGIGAVVLAQEEIEEFVHKMVERGEIADGDARKLLADILERRHTLVQEGSRKAEEEFDKRVEGILARMNIPSKVEIDALSTRIAELSRKVDELKVSNPPK